MRFAPLSSIVRSRARTYMQIASTQNVLYIKRPQKQQLKYEHPLQSKLQNKKKNEAETTSLIIYYIVLLIKRLNFFIAQWKPKTVY